MKHYKTIFILVCVGLLIIAIWIKQNSYDLNAKESNISSPSTAPIEQLNYISRTYNDSKREIMIEANVELNNINSAENIVMSMSKANLEKMLNDLLFSKGFEDNMSNEMGYCEWIYVEDDRLVLSFSADDIGNVRYYDSTRNINGISKEDKEHMFEEGFFTKEVATGMNCTSQEAAELVSNFFEKYSCLDFKAWNIVAVENELGVEFPGCYRMHMQGLYKGIPILLTNETSKKNIGAYAYISSEGIFSFQGTIPVEIKSSHSLESVISPEEILNKMEATSMIIFPEGKSTVDKISFEYLCSESTSGDSCTLQPVWVFYCNTQNPNSGNSIVQKMTFFADSGIFAGVYYF